MYVGLLLICTAFAGCMQGMMNETFATKAECEEQTQIAIADTTREMLEKGMMVKVQHKCVPTGQFIES